MATRRIFFRCCCFLFVLIHIRASFLGLSCDNLSAYCGKGTCKSSGSLFGVSCECDPGWTNTGGHEFLPCVIPNCTTNYTCSREAEAPPSHPPVSSPSLPLLNICSFAPCGEGTCVNSSLISYGCDCKPGYSNLLNNSHFPCFASCVFGADCSNLGIGAFGSGSPSKSPNSTAASPSQNEGATFFPQWLLLLVLLSVQLTHVEF